MHKALIAFIALLGLFSFSTSTFANTEITFRQFSPTTSPTEKAVVSGSVGSQSSYAALRTLLGCDSFGSGYIYCSGGITYQYLNSVSTASALTVQCDLIANKNNLSQCQVMCPDNTVAKDGNLSNCSTCPDGSGMPVGGVSFCPEPDATTCPDGSPAPNNDTSQCSADTRTQRWCAISQFGSDVCFDIPADNLSGGCSAMCSAMGSSCAGSDPANNVGSCANGTPIAFFGYKSAPLANRPPNAVQCSTSSCVSDTMNGITRTTNPDGSNTVTQVFPDGKQTSTVTSPNGTEKVTTTTPDGTVSIVISSPNGSTSSSTTSPDGTTSTSTSNPDGSSSSSTTSPNGNSTSTKTSSSGTTTTTTIINGIKTITITAAPPTPPPTTTPPPAPPATTGVNSTDLKPVVDRLSYLADAARVDATQTQEQLSQSFYANQRLAELVSSGGATLTALNEVKTAVLSSNQAVGTKLDGLGTSLDGIGQKIDQTNSKLDGIGTTLDGIKDGLSGTDLSLSEPSDSQIKDALGIANSPGIGDLHGPDVDLTNFTASYTGWLSNNKTCPSLPPVQLPFGGEFTWNFTLLCDILSIFGVLVMTAAYISVPFIVFGGKK